MTYSDSYLTRRQIWYIHSEMTVTSEIAIVKFELKSELSKYRRKL